MRTSSSTCWRRSVPHETAVGTAARNTERAKRIGPESSLHREKTTFCTYMRRWIFTNCCGNEFMTYVSLHTLNPLSAACKSDRDKTARKKMQ